MNYHIGRDGQQLGTFTGEQITEGLANGTLRGTDLAWAEGMEDWQPVSGLMLGNPAPLPPPVPVRMQGVASFPSHSGQPQTSGLAIASLVLGILSFLFACLTALPAVVCGHLALGKIRRSDGSLSGSGMAITGLVIGYIFIAIIPVVAVLAALAAPGLFNIQDRAHQAQSINNTRQVIISLKMYAADHGGKYPATLDELIKTAPEDEKLLDYPQFTDWSPEKGYEYAGGSDAEPGQKVILMSRSHSQSGKRILGHNDGSVEIAVPASETLK